MSKYEHAHYGTTSAVDNMTWETTQLDIQNSVRHYDVRGFRIVLLMVNMQFKPLKDYNEACALISIVIRGCHVSQIEQLIQVLELREKFHYDMLPFE